MATQTEDQKLNFNTDYCLMRVKSIAECSKHSAILSTFIKLPFVFKTFVLSIFEWPLKTGFTVSSYEMKVQINNLLSSTKHFVDIEGLSDEAYK